MLLSWLVMLYHLHNFIMSYWDVSVLVYRVAISCFGPRLLPSRLRSTRAIVRWAFQLRGSRPRSLYSNVLGFRLYVYKPRIPAYLKRFCGGYPSISGSFSVMLRRQWQARQSRARDSLNRNTTSLTRWPFRDSHSSCGIPVVLIQ